MFFNSIGAHRLALSHFLTKSLQVSQRGQRIVEPLVFVRCCRLFFKELFHVFHDGLLGISNPLWQFVFVQFSTSPIGRDLSNFRNVAPSVFMSPIRHPGQHQDSRLRFGFALGADFGVSRMSASARSQSSKAKSVNAAALLIQLVGALADALFDVACKVRLPRARFPSFRLGCHGNPPSIALSIRDSLCDCWGKQSVIQITFLAQIGFVNIQRARKRLRPNVVAIRAP